MNTTDARVAEYCSRAQERLLYKGKWVGTYGRFRVCINEGCLTWPREIETIETAALCDIPIDVRNEWYEFLGSGPGIQHEDCGIARQLIDRGDACAFDDVTGTGKKLAVYADSADDVGKQILLRYYTSNGIKKYTTVSGDTIEGEYVTLVAPPAYAYSGEEVLAGGFYDVVKPATVRTVRVYQYTVADASLKPLAYYEPDETNPVYRRSLIPCLSNSCGGEDAGDCGNHNIDIMGKFRQRPVTKDSDALIIQSGEALRMAVQALRKEEDNLFDDADNYWRGRPDPRTGVRNGGAVGVLEDQLRHWQGDGQVQPIRIIGAGHGEPVLNLV